jgi:peroxiredoxin
MKKVLFIAAVSGSLFMGCNSHNFTVNGTVEGASDGKAYLIAFNETQGGIDTLATASITSGKFTLKGNVEEPRFANIIIEKKNFPLLLEKSVFTATITYPTNEGGTPATPVAEIKGGEGQEVYKLFNEIQQEFSLKVMELQMALATATDAVERDSIEQLFIECQENVMAKEMEIIKANPDAYATAFQVYNRALGIEDAEGMKEMYNLLGEKGKATKYGKLIEEQIQQMERVAIGQIAPDFKVVTPAGDSISLYGIEAKVKLIDFWASWCAPCRAENPNVVKAYAEYQSKGLEIIGVSLDSERENWLDAIEVDGLTWKHGIDQTGATAMLYGVVGIPHTLLLDQNNRILDKNLRGDELKAKLAELLD